VDDEQLESVASPWRRDGPDRRGYNPRMTNRTARRVIVAWPLCPCGHPWASATNGAQRSFHRSVRSRWTWTRLWALFTSTPEAGAL